MDDVNDARAAANARANAAMDRYAEGDDEAFAELYDALAPRLFQYLLRQTRDQARAEDLLQQTMLQLHANRGRFIRGSDVSPWAFAIARRVLIDRIRKGKREPMTPTEVVPEAEDLRDGPADEQLHSARLAQRVREELSRLPEPQRTAFELTRMDGLSLKDVAMLLGTTVNAVKLRVSRANSALRVALERERNGGP